MPQATVTSTFPYVFEVLPLTSLFVDPKYQRPLSPFAQQIAKEFNPMLVGTLVASERGNGRYAVVDGQSRLFGAGENKISHVPCIVFRGLSVPQEAKMFAQLQIQRRRMHSVSRFNAELVAKNSDAVEIDKIAFGQGFLIKEAGGPDALKCVRALERAYAYGGPDHLKETLSILRRAWKREKTIPGEVVRGLSAFLRNEEPGKPIKNLVLVRALAAVEPKALVASARALRKEILSGGASNYVESAVQKAYQAELRKS